MVCEFRSLRFAFGYVIININYINVKKRVVITLNYDANHETFNGFGKHDLLL